jgi:hypothetical protein
LSNSASFFTASGDTLGAFGKQIKITLMLSRLPWEEKVWENIFVFFLLFKVLRIFIAMPIIIILVPVKMLFLRRKNYAYMWGQLPPNSALNV